MHTEFERNVADRGEIDAAIAAYRCRRLEIEKPAGDGVGLRAIAEPISAFAAGSGEPGRTGRSG